MVLKLLLTLILSTPSLALAAGAGVLYPGNLTSQEPTGCVYWDATSVPYTFHSTGIACNTANAAVTKTFADLGTPGNGTMYYCSDCSETTPCTGSGTGAFAERVNGAWRCAVTASVTAGQYIDVSGGVVSMDPTEVNDVTWGDGSESAITVTYNTSGLSDQSWQYSDQETRFTGDNLYTVDAGVRFFDSTQTNGVGFDPGTQIFGVVGTGQNIATSGDSATAFFTSGAIELARGGTNQSTWTASRCVRVNNAGTALEVAGADCSSGGFNPVDVDDVTWSDGATEATITWTWDATGTPNPTMEFSSAGINFPNETVAFTDSSVFMTDSGGDGVFFNGTTLAPTGSGTITATTADALAANGSNCSAGEAAKGVDAAGVAEGCEAFGDVTGVGPSCNSGHCFSDNVATTSSIFVLWEGTTVDDNEWQLNAPVSDPLSDIVHTFPSVSGTLITTGDTATVTATMLATDSVSADELNATGVKAELEAVLDLANLQGTVTDAQVPNNITIDSANAVEGTDLGTLTDGRFCTYSLSGTEIVCDTALTGGQGITVSGGTITFAPSEETNLTWSNGGSSTATHTFSLSGSNDPDLVARDGAIAVATTGNPQLRIDDKDIGSAGGGHADASLTVACTTGPACSVNLFHSLGNTTFGNVIQGAQNGEITVGDVNAPSLTVTTDGTGDGEVVLPDDSIGIAEAAFLGTLTDTKLCTYDSGGGVINCTADDDDTPESGDFTNLTGGHGIDNNAGTLDLDLTELNNASYTLSDGSQTTLDFGFNLSSGDWTFQAGGGFAVFQGATLTSRATTPSLNLGDTDFSNVIGASITADCTDATDCTGTVNYRQDSGSRVLITGVGSTGAVTVGNALTTSITLTTDGTGNDEVVLPNDSIGIAEAGFLGTLTNGRACTYDSANTEIDCDTVLSGAQNLFETINVPSGTDPVADSTTDTLNLAASGIITITGDSATDTVTFGATETDPQVGAVTNGNFCLGDGSAVQCSTASITSSHLGTDSVSADELNATGVEAELEAVLDLQDLQGAVTDAQVPNSITIDSANAVEGTDLGTLTNGRICTYDSSNTEIDCDLERPITTLIGHAPGATLGTIHHFGIRTNNSGSIGNSGAIIPFSGTAKNFCCNSSVAPGGGQDYVWVFNYHATEYSSMAATALTCTQSGSGVYGCCDTSNTASVTQGGFWVFSVDGSAGAASTAVISCSVGIY